MDLGISKRLLLLLLILIVFLADSALILSPPNGAIYRTATLSFNRPWRDISNLTMINWGSNTTLANKVVLFAQKKSGDVPIQPSIKRVQKSNPAVIVLRDLLEIPGKVWYATTGNDGGIYTPVVSISPDLFDELWALVLSNETVSNVTVTDEQNEWEELLSSHWVFILVQVPFFVWPMLLGGLCIYKMIRLGFYRNFRLSNVLFLAFFELVVALLRAVQAIDLWGIRRIYHMYFVDVMNTAAIPFALASFLISALKWHEVLLDKQIDINGFLSKMRIPFIVTIVIALIVYIVLQIASFILGTSGLISGITISIYLLAFLCIGIFYNVTAIRVLLRLRKCPNNQYTNKIKKIIYKGSVTGILLILLAVYPFLFLPVFFNTPQKWLGVLISFVFLLLMASTVQISSFLGNSGLSRGLKRDRDQDRKQGSSNEPSATTTSS